MADQIITISSHTSDNHAKLCVSSDVEMVHLWDVDKNAQAESKGKL